MPDCKIIGTWSRKGGNINVTIKSFGYKARYLGDEDDPTSPALVTRDLQAEFPGAMPKLLVTNRRGGKIVSCREGL